jgi:hypothetical protein
MTHSRPRRRILSADGNQPATRSRSEALAARRRVGLPRLTTRRRGGRPRRARSQSDGSGRAEEARPGSCPLLPGLATATRSARLHTPGGGGASAGSGQLRQRHHRVRRRRRSGAGRAGDGLLPPAPPARGGRAARDRRGEARASGVRRHPRVGRASGVAGPRACGLTRRCS